MTDDVRATAKMMFAVTGALFAGMSVGMVIIALVGCPP